MQYRRDYTQGASYFFTVVTFRRVGFLTTEAAVNRLRQVFKEEMTHRPFVIDAIVILPDHIHSLWTLPKDDADYSMRWRNIKRAFTQQIAADDRPAVFASRHHKGEQAIWQRRFWEHRIRDEEDFSHHIDYIHYNPVTVMSNAPPIGHTTVFTDTFGKACYPQHGAVMLSSCPMVLGMNNVTGVGWVGNKPTQQKRGVQRCGIGVVRVNVGLPKSGNPTYAAGVRNEPQQA